MAQRNGAAARVQACRVGAERALPGQRHAGKGFIDLVVLDLVELQAALPDRALAGGDRGGQHHDRIVAAHVERHEARARLQAQALRHRFAHQQHGGGAVTDLRGIARGHVPADLREARAEFVIAE
ncbi:hypothetical protein D9M72_576260 [compost metagenome]